MKTIDLSTSVGRLKLKNPAILASGIMGLSKASLMYAAKNGAGAVTMKSVTKEPRKGHPNPIVLTFEAGMLNCVGYSNPGIEEAKKEFINLNEIGVPVIASITGKDAEEFAYMASQISQIKGFSALEIALSCPHTPGYGTMAGHQTPEATHKIVSSVRDKTKLTLFVKLSPNVEAIGKIAKTAEDAGADAITAVNTMGPGMLIDIKTAKPMLGFKVGGISGPALRPIAVRCVYDIYESVKIPIIGTGGISSGKDAIEMMMAGASAVGIGTAIYTQGIDVFRKVCDEMSDLMQEIGYDNVKSLIGKAHEN